MDYIFRLTYGCDLRQGIEQFCQRQNITSAVIVTTVGCLYEASLRLADGESTADLKDNYEIVSLTGTVSADGAHQHISLADRQGKVIGGHMRYGCLVNTTAEVALRSLDDRYRLSRQFDETTGYDELVITDLKEVCK